MPVFQRQQATEADRDWRLHEDEADNADRIGPAPGKVPALSPAQQTYGTVQREASGGAVAEDATARLDAAASSPGRSLPDWLRKKLEAALGVDLSSVTLHAGKSSADAAEAIGANAYTVGQQIHFGASKFDLSSAEGEKLIAHEVAHTVQQRQAPVASKPGELDISTPGDRSEVEAEKFADQFAGPKAQSVQGKAPTATATADSPKLDTSAGGSVLRTIIQRDKFDVAGANVDSVNAKPADFGEAGNEELKFDGDTGPHPDFVDRAVGPRIADKQETLAGALAEQEKPATVDGDTAEPAAQVDMATAEVPQPETATTAVEPQQTTTQQPTELQGAGGLNYTSSGSGSAVELAVNSPQGSTPDAKVSEESQRRAREMLAGLELRVTTIKTSVRTAAAAARADIGSCAVQRKAEIQVSVAASIEDLKQEFDTAKSGIDDRFGQIQDDISKAAEQARGTIARQTIEQRHRVVEDAKHEQVRFAVGGTKAAQNARELGEQHAQRALTRSQQQAAEARHQAQIKNKTYSHSEKPDCVEAMTQAVSTVAEDHAHDAIEAGKALAEAARQEANKIADSVLERTKEMGAGLIQDMPALEAQIDEFASVVKGQVDKLETSAIEGLEMGRQTAHNQLDGLLAPAITRYQAIGTAVSTMIDQTKVKAIEEIDKAEADYLRHADETLEATKHAVNGVDNPDLTSIRSAVDLVGGQLDASAKAAVRIIGQAKGKIIETLSSGANRVAADLATSNVALSEQLTETTKALCDQLAESGEHAASRFGELGGSMEQGGAEISREYTRGVRATVDKSLAELNRKVENGLGEIGHEVTEGLARNDKELAKLPDKLDTAADKMREKFKAPWYKGLGNFLLGALKAIAFLLAAVLGAIVIVIIAVIAGVSLSLIATIALILAVVAIIIVAVASIVMRVLEYRAIHGESPGFWTSLGIGVIGILDTLGLPLIWEAVSGERLFSGRELTDMERGASFMNGIIAFFTTLLAIRSVTSARQVHTAVTSAEKVASVTDDLARVGSVTDDAARVAGVTDDAARVGGVTDDAARVGGTTDDAGRAANVADDIAKAWDNPSLNPSESWALYKSTAPSGKLTWNQFQHKFSMGWRYDPSRHRWARPPSATSVAPAAGLGDEAARVAGTTDDAARIASTADDAARLGEAQTALAETTKIISDTAKKAESALPTLDALASSSDPKVASLAVRARDSMKEFIDLAKTSLKWSMDTFENIEMWPVEKLFERLARTTKETTRLGAALRGHNAADELDDVLHGIDKWHQSVHRALETWYHYSHSKSDRDVGGGGGGDGGDGH